MLIVFVQPQCVCCIPPRPMLYLIKQANLWSSLCKYSYLHWEDPLDVVVTVCKLCPNFFVSGGTVVVKWDEWCIECDISLVKWLLSVCCCCYLWMWIFLLESAVEWRYYLQVCCCRLFYIASCLGNCVAVRIGGRCCSRWRKHWLGADWSETPKSHLIGFNNSDGFIW